MTLLKVSRADMAVIGVSPGALRLSSILQVLLLQVWLLFWYKILNDHNALDHNFSISDYFLDHCSVHRLEGFLCH